MEFTIEVTNKQFHGVDFERIIITGDPSAPIGGKREAELKERVWQDVLEKHDAINSDHITYFGLWRWEIQ